MPLRDWLQLSLTDGIGPILQGRLVAACGSAAAACDASAAVLRNIDGIGAARASSIHSALRAAADEVDRELDRAADHGAQLICRDDENYPPLLKEIPDPPAVLYVKGSIEARDLNALAIVGSRKCSLYGREQAERFAALLAGAAITVVSGGARGVDAAAHRGALTHPHGRTLAVLGCGVDLVYPPENDSLFRQIAERGAVISEHALGTPPMAENFPRRNRIVSGLSRGVLVIEADVRSGALITARQAGEDHGRLVLALPGRLDNKLSAGPHQLIRDGATLVTNLEEILEELGPLPQTAIAIDSTTSPASPSETLPPQNLFDANLSEPQQLLLSKIDESGIDADALIERSGLPAHRVMQELTFLSLRGLVRRVDGKAFPAASARGARR